MAPRMDQSLQMRQDQRLVMSPQMVQAINLLLKNDQELATEIREAMLENPALEMAGDNDGSAADARLELQPNVERVAQDAAEQANGSEGSGEVAWDKLLAHLNDAKPGGSTGGTIHDELPPIEANLTYGRTLVDHLLDQLHLTRCSEEERRIAEEVIVNLDDRGYFDAEVSDVAELLGVEVEDVDFARQMVMELEPVGCGAVNLGECLWAQARVRFPEDPTFGPILLNHLHHLERRNYAAIARALDLDLEDVVEYHKMIQELDPNPGRAFTTEDPRYVVADVQVVKVGDVWQVTLNEEGLPDLRLSRYYEKVLQSGTKEDREYIVKQLHNAQWLVQSINRRRQTIRKVMESIVKHQIDYFEHGSSHLRPMILEDVAQDIGVHMSTVSRVTTGKYANTPHGIVELKYFFSSSVGQGDLAAEAIKTKIRAIIADENPNKPLSDEAIKDALGRDGIEIARKTVQKYRESMGILSSKMRKQV